MNQLNLFLRLVLLMAGAVAAPANADLHRIEQDHPSVSYTGSWETVPGASLSGGSLALTGQEGATVSVTFTGTGISWISYLQSSLRGTTRVYLDGVLIGGTGAVMGVIDFYMARIGKFGVYGLPHASHVLTIETTSEYPNFSSRIAVDAFIIQTGAVTRPIEESDATVTYTGTWMEIDDPGVSGGSVLASREAGATATVRFRGTGISWIGYRCDCADGLVRITLDGIERTYFYTAPIGRHAQSIMFSAAGAQGLPDGEHELKIEVEGRALGGNAPWVVIDAFRVQTGTTDGPDTTPPEVIVRSPTEGETGRVRLIADTFDNVGVTGVRYYVDDVEFTPDSTLATSGLTNLWFNPAFSPRGISNGPHALTAVARDAAGNETRSAPVTVIVDITPPTVTLNAPAPGSQVTGVVTLSATATGDYRSGVSFYARSSDGIVTDLGRDYEAPYTLQRDTSSIPSGRTFTLWAEVNDGGGYPVTSPTTQVTVQH